MEDAAGLGVAMAVSTSLSAITPVGRRAPSTTHQGPTLVHFSARRKHLFAGYVLVVSVTKTAKGRQYGRRSHLFRQGLTLVHLSARRKRSLQDTLDRWCNWQKELSEERKALPPTRGARRGCASGTAPQPRWPHARAWHISDLIVENLTSAACNPKKTNISHFSRSVNMSWA